MNNTKINNVRNMVMNSPFNKKVKDALLTLTLKECQEMMNGIVDELNGYVREANEIIRDAKVKCEATDEYKRLKKEMDKCIDAYNAYLPKYDSIRRVYQNNLDTIKNEIIKSEREKWSKVDNDGNTPHFINISDEVNRSINAAKEAEEMMSKEQRKEFEEVKLTLHHLERNTEKSKGDFVEYCRSFKGDNERKYANLINNGKTVRKKVMKFIKENWRKFSA